MERGKRRKGERNRKEEENQEMERGRGDRREGEKWRVGGVRSDVTLLADSRISTEVIPHTRQLQEERRVLQCARGWGVGEGEKWVVSSGSGSLTGTAFIFSVIMNIYLHKQ